MLETSPPDARVTLANLLLETRRRLAEAGVETPALDARILVEHFSGTTRTDVISEPDRVVDAATVVAIDDALRRRAAGEPVHRILGFREFYGLHLALSPDTLEPRPDTETLVDAVLAHVEAIAAKEGRCRILDLGTGTGAIALALLSAVPGALATGADISGDALATAARNARDLGLSDRFETLKTDWFREISGRYHVIAANPPYIPSSDIEALQAEVREFDPRRALNGGQDGLGAYRTIAAGAGAYLEAGGIVAVEIGSTQKRDATSLFEQAGFDLMVSRRDFSGNDRVLVFSARERT